MSGEGGAMGKGNGGGHTMHHGGISYDKRRVGLALVRFGGGGAFADSGCDHAGVVGCAEGEW